MLTIKYQTTFKKDYKRIKKREYDSQRLQKVIELLSSGQILPPEYKDHKLIGTYYGCRACHITPDWLLVYEINDTELILYLTRTGTHSDLFYGYKSRKNNISTQLIPLTHVFIL